MQLSGHTYFYLNFVSNKFSLLENWFSFYLMHICVLSLYWSSNTSWLFSLLFHTWTVSFPLSLDIFFSPNSFISSTIFFFAIGPFCFILSFTKIPFKTFWRSFRTKILRFIEKVLECWMTREKDMQTLCLCEQRLSSSAINSKLFDGKAFHFSTFILSFDPQNAHRPKNICTYYV